MNIEDFRLYCLSKAAVTETFPFDQFTLVFKVGGKMFALTDVRHFEGVNLKCDPVKAIELRETYEWVKPGWHMNKTHWNTVEITWDMDDKLFLSWVDHSYDLVLASLPKKLRESITSNQHD